MELKREGPKEALKGDESKEVVGDQAPAVEQALPVEEEEDILQPYYEYLTPTEIEAFRIIETVRVQNKYLTLENILLQEHIITLRSIIQRLEYLLSPRISTLLPRHHHHHLLHHQRRLEYRVWALPLACAKLVGSSPVSYHTTPFALIYLSSIFSYLLN